MQRVTTTRQLTMRLNVEQEQDKDDARFHQLLNMLFSLCELADFHIEGRVVLKDKRTGKVWR